MTPIVDDEDKARTACCGEPLMFKHVCSECGEKLADSKEV
jgi:hypothetical protein